MGAPDWDKTTVPLMLHGDAAPCLAVGKAGSKSFDVCSMQGVLSEGPTREVKLYLFGLFESSKSGGASGPTMHKIWKRVLWSFHYLQLGIWPLVDDNGDAYPAGCAEASKAGTPLAEGFRAVLWLLKQDIEHTSSKYGLAHHSSNEPCPLCPANRGQLSMRFNNFRKDAAWKRKLFTYAIWKSRYGSVHFFI